MNSLPYPILTNVLDVISASSEYADFSLVRQKALDVLFRTISAEGAILILPDQTAFSSRVMIKNLDEKFSGYYLDYYHQFDPLKLIQGMHRNKQWTCVDRICTYSYDSQQPTEYYTDFLKPQKIHHKLIANLVAEEEVYGRVVWMRSQKANRFTHQDVRLAKAVSPYLGHALAYNALRQRLKLKGKILDYVEKQSSVGIILLDEKLQVVYINQKAEELFDALEGSAADGSGREQILFQVLTDCREIRDNMKGRPADFMAIPRKRTIGGRNANRFAATYKALTHASGAGNAELFMVCIEEKSLPVDVNPRHLMDAYRLSKREIDVASLLFEGLKNAQIADKLFISEITVKKHLQNIYTKVGVNNRTSLINKMLTH
jgi:DNA-binding CsgD family transcriptional regulator/PAS domain-containing protein